MGRLLSRIGIVVALGCTGCTAYGGLAWEPDGPVPDGAALESDRIVLPVGSTLRIFARLESRTSVVYEDPEALELVAVDPEIVSVLPDAVEPWRWVLIGRARGDSCLDIVDDGEPEDCLPVSAVGVAQ